MPIYEYRCGQCQTITDVLQLKASAPPPRCKACQSDEMEKLISRTSFHLKGSGWYTSDYVRNTADDAAKAEPKAGGEGSAEGQVAEKSPEVVKSKSEGEGKGAGAESKPAEKVEKVEKAAPSGAAAAASSTPSA
jgi:putative FmdB family regulatory protein